MPVEDLGFEAAELLSLNIGEAKSLNKLAELAVSQVPGCSAAHATIWRNDEIVGIAATHPDPAELAEEELRTGRGPLTTAAFGCASVNCPDTLAETRWPEWSEEALRRGVRSSVHLVRQIPPITLVLALFGVRPMVLEADAVPMAEMLAQIGSTVFANTLAYDQAQRTATQLKDSVAARAVTDQAKGILMHALGCDAEEALRYLRRESQRRHLKVTEVAARIIATYGGRDGDRDPETSRKTGTTGSLHPDPLPPFPACAADLAQRGSGTRMTRRRIMSGNKAAGRSPAVPAASVAPHGEPDEPADQHERRDPPQRVQGEAEHSE
jgi:hypothetical protein